MKEVMETLNPHADKLKVLLNKADSCDKQQLMRVYGALMWSIRGVIETPEVVRVYLGSFRDDAYNPRGHENYDLYDKEKADLMRDLNALPRNSVMRKARATPNRER